MKRLALAVSIAVVALTGLTVWFGARVREDTVVEHPYEEGLALTLGHARHHTVVGTAADDHAVAGRAAVAAAPACDLGAGPCTRAVDGAGGLELSADLGPRPLAAMRELAVAVELRRAEAPVDGAAVRVAFAMAGMEMGENAVALAPAGGGRYQGKAILVRCPSGRHDWIATVTFREGGVERRVELPLRLGE
jgi:hypothetical protein